MKRVIFISVLLLVGGTFSVFGQEFGKTSTAYSYTEQLEVQDASSFALEVRRALSFRGFRQIRETKNAMFLLKPVRISLTNSEYIQYYDVATIWTRNDSTVRVHIWRKQSNLHVDYYRVWNMPEFDIVRYRRVLNEYFQSNQ